MVQWAFISALTLVSALALALVYGVGGLMVIAGSLTIGSLLALAALAWWVGPYLPYVPEIELASGSVDALLNIVASSMLTVTTFSMSIIVGAYGSATTSATPRSNTLLAADPAIDHAALLHEAAQRDPDGFGDTLGYYGVGPGPYLFLPLLGEHQAQNLAVAVAALEMFLGGGERPLDEELLREGLSQVTSPGRLEVLRTAPTLIVDAAHNPDGVRATARAVQEAFGFTRLSLVVGILQEKDAPGMLAALYRAFGDDVEDLAVTQSSSARAIPAGELARMAVDAGWPEDDVYATESVPDALEWAVGRAEALETSADELASGTGGGVLVLGSITLAAEVRTLVGEPRHAGPVTVAARGLDPADLLDAVGLADADEDDLDPEILELLEDRDDAGARRRPEEDR